MSLSKSKCWYSNNCLHFSKYAVPFCNDVFAITCHFHPSLILVSKAEAYPSEAPFTLLAFPTNISLARSWQGVTNTPAYYIAKLIIAV
jgi:hypothetical protein